MKRFLSVVLALLAVGAFLSVAFAKGPSGKELFEKNCASCHANGGNMDNPAFTLHKKDLRKHKVDSVKGIVGKMRHPGPGMPTFSEKMISDAQAKEIARYILKAFK